MHNGALRKWALALTFWLALHTASVKAQIFTQNTSASGYDSSAFGFNTTASGRYAVAFGCNTQAIGRYSTASGYNTSASGNYSTVSGQYAYATGPNSFASGLEVTASGSCAVAFGLSTIASGGCSLTSGLWTTASGNYSTAFGLATTAQAYESFAIGQYNLNLSEVGTSPSATSWNPADPLFEIGNGSSLSVNGTNTVSPSDAFVVYKNGDAAVEGALTASSVVITAPGGDIPMYTGN